MDIMKADEHRTPVQEFYSGANILITGATGFLGKALMLKLLLSCPDINTIYIVVRSKKGKNMETRIQEILQDQIFSKMQEKFPKLQYKVQGVSGDMSLPSWGLSEHDRKILISQVSVVFHVAATVKFNEILRSATNMNVKGTQSILALSKEMKNLKAFVHVSTAYSHCNRSFIEEKFYPPPIEITDLFALLDGSDDQHIQSIEKSLLGDWPNTYTYTKAIAEEVIRTEGLPLPVGVVRPSIVISAYLEPFRGWADNFYGPTGVTAGAATGLMRTMYMNTDYDAQTVPVDFCVNSVICCACDIADAHMKHKKEQRKKTDKDIPVYNYVSKEPNMLNWDQFMGYAAHYGLQYPCANSVWIYSCKVNRSLAMHWVYAIFLQFIPALFLDSISWMLGKKAQLFKLYRRLVMMGTYLHYFANTQWKFGHNNVDRLWTILDKKDQKTFYFELNDLDWEDYFKDYVKGIRLFLLKDPLKTLPEAIIRRNRLYWMHQFVKYTVIFLLARLVWFLSSYVYSNYLTC